MTRSRSPEPSRSHPRRRQGARADLLRGSLARALGLESAGQDRGSDRRQGALPAV